MQYTNIIFITLLTVLHFQWVISSGIFHLNVKSFYNPSGRDEQGFCCGSNETKNSETPSNETCPTSNSIIKECQTFFRICITHVPRLLSYFTAFRRRLDPNSPCSFGLVLTDVLTGNNLTSDKAIQRNFTFDFAYPGRFVIIFEAWHSPNDTDVATEGGRLIMRHVEERRLKIGDEWANRAQSSDHGDQKVAISYRVTCAKGFTGADCRQKCPKPGKESKSSFNCSEDGLKICNPGWTGKDCEKAVCTKGCSKEHGYCEVPNECKCRLGWEGETCENCVTMPGCQYGSCNKTFECVCNRGWDGFFCSSPICVDGCHSTRGYCEQPGECRCRYGWQGPLCEACKPLPGCVHGSCNKPLDCICNEGWMGMFCSLPECRKGCDPANGYCKKPGDCRCRVGWYGDNCSECFPYPGCKNGTCNKPWECNCKEGWTGLLCDTKIELCGDNGPCPEGSKCQKDACVCEPNVDCQLNSPEERD